MDKEMVVYTPNGILFCLKSLGILSFVITWMNLEDLTLCEISHTQKDKDIQVENKMVATYRR
jgi:hypothetical protein